MSDIILMTRCIPLFSKRATVIESATTACSSAPALQTSTDVAYQSYLFRRCLRERSGCRHCRVPQPFSSTTPYGCVASGQLLRWPTAAYLVSLPYVMSAIADICPLYVVCHRHRTWNGGKLGGGSQTSVVAEMDNTTMHNLPAELAGAEVIVVGD